MEKRCRVMTHVLFWTYWKRRFSATPALTLALTLASTSTLITLTDITRTEDTTVRVDRRVALMICICLWNR